ncbi:MAG: CNNM domain-containing protein, partial [Alphaproteobacteria bacterium]
MDPITFTIVAIFFLLACSGFFSGSETALTAASRPRMHQLASDGNKRARTVSLLHAQQERLIGGILIGNNIVNILASALATSVMIQLFGDAGVAYA